jgi:drug/metabolite transporter (DMT)-like permease
VRLRGFIFTLTTACMFGLGTALAKVVGEAFNPFFVSWLALLCGGFCVSACQLIRRKPLVPRMTRASWGDLFLFASIGTALPLVCVVVGMAQTSAITGSFLLQLQGPAAIFCSMLFLKEKMIWKQAGGIALLLVGSLLVILRDLHSSLQVIGGQGDLFVIVAALGLGFSYIPGKRLTERGDAGDPATSVCWLLSSPAISRFSDKRIVRTPLVVADRRASPVYRDQLWRGLYPPAGWPWPAASLAVSSDYANPTAVLDLLRAAPAPRVTDSPANPRGVL